MMVIQCLMVVMESGWQTVRMPSPMPAALLTSVLFSSTVPMKSRCVCSSACRVSASSGRTPRKRSVCSASESHSRSTCTAVRNSSAWRGKGSWKEDRERSLIMPCALFDDEVWCLRKEGLNYKSAVQLLLWPVWGPAGGGFASWLTGRTLYPSGCWAPEAELWPTLCHRGRYPSAPELSASEPEHCWFSSPALFGKPAGLDIRQYLKTAHYRYGWCQTQNLLWFKMDLKRYLLSCHTV